MSKYDIKKLLADVDFYITYPSMIKGLELRELLIEIKAALSASTSAQRHMQKESDHAKEEK